MSKKLGKEKLVTIARSSKRDSQRAVSRSTLLSRECRSKLKLGTEHDAIVCLHSAGNSQGNIKLILKINDENDESSKLIVIESF